MTFTVRIVVLAAVSIALVSISTVQGYAIPASIRNVDYRRRDLNVHIIEETSTHNVQPSSTVESRTGLNQRDSDFLNQLGLFNSYYKQINVNNNNLRKRPSASSFYNANHPHQRTMHRKVHPLKTTSRISRTVRLSYPAFILDSQARKASSPSLVARRDSPTMIVTTTWRPSSSIWST